MKLATHQRESASGWRGTTLGDFISLQRGHDLPEYERRPGEVPVMGSFGITGRHDEARASGPGVTIGRSGASFGVVSYSARDYWPLNTCLYVTDFHGNDPRFAYYLMKSIDFGRYNSGSAQPSLNRNYIRDVPVRVPSLLDQRRIAATLGAFDDKIDLNYGMNRTLESIARAVFKSWFIDFDPVRKKMEGDEGGLPPALIDQFPEALDDDSGIPCGWKTAHLAELVSVSRDTVTPADIEKEQVDHYSIPAFDDCRRPAVQSGSSIKSNKFVVPDGSVLVSRLNPRIPRVWLPRLRRRPAVCSTEFLVLLPKAPVTLEFLYVLLCSDHVGEELASRVTGTSGSHQRVKPSDALSIEIAMPRESVMRSYSVSVRPLLEQAGRLLEQNEQLAETRDFLLLELLAGRPEQAAGGLA